MYRHYVPQNIWTRCRTQKNKITKDKSQKATKKSKDKVTKTRKKSKDQAPKAKKKSKYKAPNATMKSKDKVPNARATDKSTQMKNVVKGHNQPTTIKSAKRTAPANSGLSQSRTGPDWKVQKVLCRHDTYTIPPYKTIDNSKYCEINQELHQVKCAKCNLFFVNNKQSDNEYKPSRKQVVYACFNVNTYYHAYCTECWVNQHLLSSKDRTRRGK